MLTGTPFPDAPTPPEPLATPWARLRAGAPLAEVRQQVLGSGLASTSRAGPYVLGFDFAVRLAPVIDLLGKLQPLGLSIAPVVAGTRADGADLAVLLHYTACAAGEALLPVSGRAVSAEAKARFRADVQRLHAAGFSHPYLGRGLAHWRVGERSGTLVVEAWEVAQQVPAPDGSLDGVDALLARLG